MRTAKFVIVNRELHHEKIKDEPNIYLTKLKCKDDITLLDNFE